MRASQPVVPSFGVTQSDHPFALSAQKGRVVVLTFLYTNCPDECPLVAEHLRDVHDKLGADAGAVRFVAVSLDPEHDTSAAIQQFLKAHRVEDVLTYVKGTREQLAPVWKAYFLAVLPRIGDVIRSSPLTLGVTVEFAAASRWRRPDRGSP